MINFENALRDLIETEIKQSDDIIDTLAGVQANLTFALGKILVDLKKEGVVYIPEMVCLDLKRIV